MVFCSIIHFCYDLRVLYLHNLFFELGLLLPSFLLLFLYFEDTIYLPLCFFDDRFKSPCALQLAFCEKPIFLGEVDRQYFREIDGIIIYLYKYYL